MKKKARIFPMPRWLSTGECRCPAFHPAPLPGRGRFPDLSLRALRSKARQSRGTHSEHREAFGEIVSACLRFPRRFAPRNDKSEVRAILVMAGTYRQRLQCPLSHLR